MRILIIVIKYTLDHWNPSITYVDKSTKHCWLLYPWRSWHLNRTSNPKESGSEISFHTILFIYTSNVVFKICCFLSHFTSSFCVFIFIFTKSQNFELCWFIPGNNKKSFYSAIASQRRDMLFFPSIGPSCFTDIWTYFDITK